jgi:hypothetical protein
MIAIGKIKARGRIAYAILVAQQKPVQLTQSARKTKSPLGFRFAGLRIGCGDRI